MLRPKVLVTRIIPEEALKLLSESCVIDLNEEDRPLSREELKARVRDKEGLLCLLTDKIDREVMEAAPRLRVIANVAVGYDNIDIEAASGRGIMVTNTPGVLDETTADLTWALVMALARRIVEADRFVREGRFKEWKSMLLLGSDVHGKTLGIIGLGRIGQAMARRAKGFGMRVLYYSRNRASPKVEEELSAEYVDKDTLLRESDFVTLHVPLTPETFHMISRREISLMKPTAYLINTSRGPVVDETALVEALKEGRIAGAALDVYEAEPTLAPGLTGLENVVLTPHIGSATIETRTKMALLAVENLMDALSGKRPKNLVNLSGGGRL